MDVGGQYPPLPGEEPLHGDHSGVHPPDAYPEPVPMIFEGFVPQRAPEPISDTVNVSTSRRTMKGQKGPGGWNKGRKMPPIQPSEEFSEAHNAAITAFIAEDYDTAIDLCRQAVALNPEVYAAHALLSQLLELTGETEYSVEALFLGATFSKNPEAWNVAADAYLQSSTIDREHAFRQASYCYTRLLEIDPNDHESRFKRATLYRELGSNGRALRDLDLILENQPHNPSVLRVIAEICIDTRQVHIAKRKYEDYVKYSKIADASSEELFSWSDVNVYVELFAHSEEFDDAIAKLKSLARWLLGREHETYWDNVDYDDREWDALDEPRRNQISRYVPGQYPSDTYGDGLPLELRIKLGIYRLRQGFDSRAEAYQHFEWLEPEDEEGDAKVNDYADLFLEVSYALCSAKQYEEALRYLRPVRRIDTLPDTKAWLAIGECYYILDDKEEAIECYETAKDLDPLCAEARTQLSKLYTAIGDKEQAMQNGEEAVRLRRSEVKVTERRRYERKDQRLAREAAERALRAARKLPSTVKVTRLGHAKDTRPPEALKNFDFNASQTQWQLDRGQHEPGQVTLAQPRPQPRQFKRKKAAKQTTAEEREARATERVAEAYEELNQYTDGMRAGDPHSMRKWMLAADSMITDFRTNRLLYPHERHMQFKGFDRPARTETFRKKWHKERPRTLLSARSPSYDLNNSEGQSVDSADVPLPSVESPVPTEYRNILFTNWLDIFLEQALLYAKSNDKDSCYTTITAALDCSVWYHSSSAMLQIYITYFVCALHLRDGTTLFNTVARWFMRQYQFCTDTYRLFATLNLFHSYPNIPGGKDAQMLHAPFRLGPSQKFMFRQIKAVDALLPADYNADGPEGPVPAFMREELARLSKEDEEDQDRRARGGFPGFSHRHVRPQEMDLVLLTLYAHILYAAGSYPNALSYFYRAYTLEPDNPTVLLSIALSYAHQMFKRQNENRHLWLLRGLAFFQKYVDVRTRWAEQKGREDGQEGIADSVQSEIEFNRARMWQMLGMADLAIRDYEKVLLLSQAQRERDGDVEMRDAGQQRPVEEFSKEAAYAMQIIYAMNGDMEMARQITETWLVVE